MGTIWTPIPLEDFYLNRLAGLNADKTVGHCLSGMPGFSYCFANLPICIIFVSDQVPPGFPGGVRELDSNEKV